jgi:hypothetical protein
MARFLIFDRDRGMGTHEPRVYYTQIPESGTKMMRLQPLSSSRYPGDGGGNNTTNCAPVKIQPNAPYAPYRAYPVKRLTGRSKWPTPKVRSSVHGANCNRHTGTRRRNEMPPGTHRRNSFFLGQDFWSTYTERSLYLLHM